MIKLAGVDDKLQKFLVSNKDEVGARREAREAFKDIQLNIDHILFKTPCDGIEMKESYEKNSRGIEIFWKSWIPKESKPKATVFFCHGYADTCTFFFEGIARKLASSGYCVFSMDYPGFGLSEGLHGYIPSFDTLVDDVVELYSKIKENPEFKSLPSYLFGQSMGGAVALKTHLKQPKAWNGAILCAPMCKISESMVPPKLVVHMLIAMANIFPKKKLVPTKDLGDAAFREPKKREQVYGLNSNSKIFSVRALFFILDSDSCLITIQTEYNVISYKDKPRLRTAVELLKITEEIEQKLEQVTLPLLILHGEADTVTDPSVSKALYEKATSSDKKLELYKDAYHALIEGEPDETITQVLNDIISWLDEHSLKQNVQSSS